MRIGRRGAGLAAGALAACTVAVLVLPAPSPASASPTGAASPRAIGPDLPRWVSPPGRRNDARSTQALRQTLNWAGEETTGGTYTGISASWTVPAVVPSTAVRNSATWVGIGGGSASATGLIQTGTEQLTQTGLTKYTAWYELYPTLAVTVVDPATGKPYPVSPGDVVSARISEKATRTWVVSLTDTTQSWQWQQTFAYTGTARSAEWIEEAPTLGTAIQTLADFGSVAFTGMADTMSTPSASTSLEGIEMESTAGTVIAYPSAVTTTGTTRRVVISYGAPSSGSTSTPVTSAATVGYDLVGADGGVFTFGGAPFLGSLPGIHVVPNRPVTGIVVTKGGKGYYLVAADGGVFSFGDAPFLGSLPGIGVVPNQPITGIVSVGTGRGYFLVGRDGGVFSFGDAPFLGSLPGDAVHVDDIVGIAATPSGNGYWLLASTGQVYAFGAARHFGTALGTSAPAAAIAGTPTGGGYWVTATDGAVYAFGNAHQFGTLPAIGVAPNRPVVAMAGTPGTGGYWLVASDGGVFTFGDAPFVGSLPGIGVAVADIVGAATVTS